jgi:prophage regulatory protein
VTGVRVKRRTEAAQHVGLSVTTVLRLVREKKFPQPIKLTEKSVGWKVEDLDQWVNERQSA